MSTDVSVVVAPESSRYALLRAFAGYMEVIVEILRENPASAMVAGQTFYILQPDGTLSVGELTADGTPAWDARSEVSFCNWTDESSLQLRRDMNSWYLLHNPGPEAPFEATGEQFDAYLRRLCRLLQEQPGKALLADQTFYVLAANRTLQVGDVSDDGTLNMGSLQPASIEAWAPHCKDELDEALVAPRYALLPERGAPRAPIEQLEAQGCCVVVFTAEELRGAAPERVKDRLIELGWEVIDTLA